MFYLDQFIADCRSALAADKSHNLVREVVARAVCDPGRILKQLGEPVYLLDSNPTVERIAKLVFDKAVEQGLPVVRVTVWETPTSFAEYRTS